MSATELFLLFLFLGNLAVSLVIGVRVVSLEKAVRRYASAMPHPILLQLVTLAASIFAVIQIQKKLTK